MWRVTRAVPHRLPGGCATVASCQMADRDLPTSATGMTREMATPSRRMPMEWGGGSGFASELGGGGGGGYAYNTGPSQRRYSQHATHRRRITKTAKTKAQPPSSTEPCNGRDAAVAKRDCTCTAASRTYRTDCPEIPKGQAGAEFATGPRETHPPPPPHLSAMPVRNQGTQFPLSLVGGHSKHSAPERNTSGRTWVRMRTCAHAHASACPSSPRRNMSADSYVSAERDHISPAEPKSHGQSKFCCCQPENTRTAVGVHYFPIFFVFGPPSFVVFFIWDATTKNPENRFSGNPTHLHMLSSQGP